MTRQSGRLHRRSENGPGQRASKQSSRRRSQPLAKLQCEKNQLVLEGITTPCVVIKSPEKAAGVDQVSVSRPAPLPQLSWGSEEVWLNMVDKEQSYRHSKSFMQRHPGMEARMSEAYSLQRQTFYLAQDYFDRFMLTQSGLEKSVLQLIGITCLFIAAKVEEASPPKLSQMAYVTAGTYYEDEILQMELIILKALRWSLCPETAVSWLKLYLQLASLSVTSDLLEPQFPQDVYVQTARLLDLCVLDIDSLDFQYRVLAASVLCHFLQQETVEQVSGLSSDILQPCLTWMSPFAESLRRFSRALFRDLSRVRADGYDLQTHTDYLSLLDDISKQKVSNQFLTPPTSTEKRGQWDL
ncbi:hypothetical protein INR49_019768 [Caranx melampygus]|nr:hypothetical protein INR49_019768 [Caranx melampygus]